MLDAEDIKWVVEGMTTSLPGVPNTETNREQLTVLLEAFAIFMERNEARDDLWKQYGWHDSIAHMRSKLARLEVTRKLIDEGRRVSPTATLDDAVDLINYAVFYTRNVRDNNPG